MRLSFLRSIVLPLTAIALATGLAGTAQAKSTPQPARKRFMAPRAASAGPEGQRQVGAAT